MASGDSPEETTESALLRRVAEEAQRSLPDGSTLADLAAQLRARLLDLLGPAADARLPALRALLATVLRDAPRLGSSLEADVREVVGCLAAVPPERPATPEEARAALHGALRAFARRGADGSCLLLDARRNDRFVLVAQALVLSGAVGCEALIAWHADPLPERELEERGLAGHNPRVGSEWARLLQWAAAAAAAAAADSDSDDDGARGGPAGLELLSCAPHSAWHPSQARLSLYVELGGAGGAGRSSGPGGSEGSAVPGETIVVLDGLVDEGMRAGACYLQTSSPAYQACAQPAPPPTNPTRRALPPPVSLPTRLSLPPCRAPRPAHRARLGPLARAARRELGARHGGRRRAPAHLGPAPGPHGRAQNGARRARAARAAASPLPAV